MSTRPDERVRVRNLTTERIVNVALALTKSVGFDGVTMRLLADELGVTPMALYHHIGSKDALMDRVADLVESRIELPSTGRWDERLRAVGLAYERESLAHPGWTAYLQERPSMPSGRRNVDQFLTMMIESGFDEEQAARAVSVFETYMLGRLAMHAHPDRYSLGGRLPKPRKARRNGASSSAGRDDLLAYGLDVVLAGLRSTLRKSR